MTATLILADTVVAQPEVDETAARKLAYGLLSTAHERHTGMAAASLARDGGGLSTAILLSHDDVHSAREYARATHLLWAVFHRVHKVHLAKVLTPAGGA